MSIIEILRLVWINIIENRFKVLLTSLGIIVGSATIVIVIGIGQGAQQDVNEQFKNLNAGTITISDTASSSSSSGGMSGGMGGPMGSGMSGNKSSSNKNGGMSGGPMGGPMGGGMGGGMPMDMNNGVLRTEKTTFTTTDTEEITYFIPNIQQICLMAKSTSSVDGGSMDEESDMNIVGVTPEYLDITNLEMLIGSFISEEDNTDLSRVAILGYNSATTIFDSLYDAYDSTILINGKKFTVIGVLNQTGSTTSEVDIDSSIYIPLNVAKKDVMGTSYSPKIIAIADDISQIETSIASIEQLLSEMYPSGSFSVNDAGSQVSASQKSANTMSFMLIAIASIVFIVGGIGIMNVLFVTVKERTQEIGILKALGSSKKDILLQFLLEANFISIFGGVIGIILSQFIIPLIASFGTTVVNSIFNIMLALVFAIFTGTVFGFYPAYKASSLKPIEALNQD